MEFSSLQASHVPWELSLASAFSISINFIENFLILKNVNALKYDRYISNLCFLQSYAINTDN